MSESMQKLNSMRELPQSDLNQVVEVQFPSGGKNYSYIGSGNLRTGQRVEKAPVTHPKSGTNYTAPVTVVATHKVYGAQVGDKTGVSNGMVTKIPTGLKYLPGAKETQQNPNINIKGQNVSVQDYMSKFDRSKFDRKMQKLNSFGIVIGGKENA